MNCNEISRLISLQLDGEISLEQKAKLDEHISGCADCRKEMALQKALMASLTEVPAPAPSEDLGARIRAAVMSRPARIERVPLSYRVFAAAAIVMLSLAVIYLLSALQNIRVEASRTAAALAAVQKLAIAHPKEAPATVPTEAAVIEQVQVFRAVRDSVGGSCKWVVTDGNDVEIGATKSGATTAPQPAADLIVLNFEYSESELGKPLRVVSNPQFVFYSGSEVSVSLKGDSSEEPATKYRVSAEKLMGGGIRAMLNFTSECPSSGEDCNSIMTRTVLSPGKPMLIGAGENGNRRWQLKVWGVARPYNYRGPVNGTNPL